MVADSGIVEFAESLEAKFLIPDIGQHIGQPARDEDIASRAGSELVLRVKCVVTLMCVWRVSRQRPRGRRRQTAAVSLTTAEGSDSAGTAGGPCHAVPAVTVTTLTTWPTAPVGPICVDWRAIPELARPQDAAEATRLSRT